MRTTFIVSMFAAVGLLVAPTAWAQVYSYPSSPYVTPQGGSCLNLSRDLSVGSRGSDVTTLQNFLVAQNYPGGGSWMVTGYFGQATRAAVMNFQRSRGLAATGISDAQMRAMISNCAYTPTTPTINYNYGSYPYYGSALSINSLSTYSGTVGTSVTIYGSGFDPSYNTVYFGATPLLGNIASNGSSVTFTVPSNAANCSGYGCYSFGNTAPGTYQVYVMNARGTSNKLNFVVTGSGGLIGGCGYYGGLPAQTGYGCGGYTYGTPSLSFLNPNSGAVGTSVTVYGSGFSPRNNTVNFGTGIVTGLSSFDGVSLSFTVPSQLTGYGSQTLVLGTYNVSVTNEYGLRSNALPFTVTGFAPATIAPRIQSVSGPTSLSTGVQGLWAIAISNLANSSATVSVRWGDEGLYGIASAAQTSSTFGQQTLTFTHTYYQQGTYTVVFTATNASGLSNTSTITVMVSGTAATIPTLYSVSPNQARSGTLVMLTGSGFLQSGNTVRFGVGGSTNLTSTNNGTLIYYTIPYWTSPCDLITPGTVCGAPVTQVTPGTYQISVTNTSGQSQVVNFTVVQ
ncbi:MAG: NlpC/P60 family protein [Parcubacteria group bacterium GW2011_GWA2_51_10]|nr:MAG: NlpC/P60 family protein [Parcubacteria group bacterium GW2011_GWA2_51_10]